MRQAWRIRAYMDGFTARRRGWRSILLPERSRSRGSDLARVERRDRPAQTRIVAEDLLEGLRDPQQISVRASRPHNLEPEGHARLVTAAGQAHYWVAGGGQRIGEPGLG